MKPPLNPCVPSSVPSSILCPSVQSSMRIDTLEAPRLPAALCWVWHCSFLPTKNGKEINQEWNNNNLRWWCCWCCRNVTS
jgi:hypothetical protein